MAWKPFLPRRDVASVRLRCVLPARLLARRGWRTGLYSPGERYDAVVFQKAYEAADISLAASLRAAGVKTVFDLCDNHFHGAPPERVDRLNRMIETVDLVTVSTPEVGALVPRESVVVGDALEVPWASPSLPRLDRDALRVVWFGHAGTEDPPVGLANLRSILPDLAAVRSLRLTVISNAPPSFDAPFPVRYHRWRRWSFGTLFRQNDVCVIPVADNPFTRCKTANRLVLSLMLGLPVVADPIPSYREFEPYVLFSDWTANLRRYAADPSLRHRHVTEGRAYIENHHGNDTVASQWTAALARVI